MNGRFHQTTNLVPLRWLTWWYAAAITTGICQLLLQTDLLFVVLAQGILLLMPTVFRTLEQAGSMVALVFLAVFAKMFVVSQWVKIAFLQPADTHLDRPIETVFVLFLSVLAFWIAGLAARPLIAKRSALVPIPQDPRFLLRLAGVAVALCIASIAIRYNIGITRVGETEYVEGTGLVVVFFLGNLLSLAVTALTARACILSGGRRYADALVVLAIAAGVLHGLWDNQRWIMMAGVVAHATTYLVYGGRIKGRHFALVGAVALLMHFVVFPLVDLQRGFQRDISAWEYASQTAGTFVELFDADRSAADRDRLDQMYYGWDTRLYYGEPTGFFDRFSPSPLDETARYVDVAGPFGIAQLAEQSAYGVPNMLLRLLDIDRTPRTSEVLETAIHGIYTNMNYGVMAEVLATVGFWYFLPTLTIVVWLYILILHVVYGSLNRNYFAAFGFSTLYFNFALSDLGDVIPQVTIQGTLCAIVLMVTAVACGEVGPLHAGARRRSPALVEPAGDA